MQEIKPFHISRSLLPQEMLRMHLGAQCHSGIQTLDVSAEMLNNLTELPRTGDSFFSEGQIIQGHNDTYGDCVPTGFTNALARHMYSVGDDRQISNDLPVDLYIKAGNFNPKNPSTDKGMLPATMFKWAKANPIMGYLLSDWTSIDPQRVTQVKAALQHYKSVLFIIRLTQAQANQMVWTPVTSPLWGYHCMCSMGFAGPLFYDITWGECIPMEDEMMFPAWGARPQIMEAYALNFVKAN